MSKEFFQGVMNSVNPNPPVSKAATQTSALTPAPAPQGIIVQSGDTLGRLGATHGFDYKNAQIMRDGKSYNIGNGVGDINPNQIRVGDQVIPNPKTPNQTAIEEAIKAADEQGTERDVEEISAKCCPPPKWMPIAIKEYGVKEIVGSKHNSRVVKYHQEGGSPWFDDDETPWCGSFVGWVMKQSGYKIAKNPARALSWKDEWYSGKKISKPIYGAIAVKSRKGGGHVGFVVGKNPNKKGHLAILGGNQSNEVNVSSYAESVFTFMVPSSYPHSCCTLENYGGKIGKAGSEQ